MKPAALLFSSLLMTMPFAVQADSQGPLSLSAEQMDAVTAAGLPLFAISANSGAVGDFVITSTDAVSLVTGHPILVQFGSPMGYVTAGGGIATATSYGEGASRSTAISTSTDPTPSPFSFVIDKTVGVLGSQVQVYSSVVPGGMMMDWFAYQLSKL